MKKRSPILTLTMAMALLSAIAFNALAQKGEMTIDAAGASGAALGTGLISLAPGQSVRISAVNVGGKEIQGQFLFVPVTEEGKVAVPIRCDWSAASGDAASDVIQHPGGVNIIQFYVQVRVEDAKDIGLLVPSAQIIDQQTGGMLHVLSGGDFFSIRPIFNPPFILL